MKTTRTFQANLESVAAARHHARETLSHLPPELLDAAELMVSELATNSITHAHSSFRLVIEQSPNAIRVEVHDTGHGHPTLASPQPRDPSGRGLLIVELMSSTWGIERSPRGKVVWFTLDVPLAPPLGAETAAVTAPEAVGAAADLPALDGVLAETVVNELPDNPGPLTRRTNAPQGDRCSAADATRRRSARRLSRRHPPAGRERRLRDVELHHRPPRRRDQSPRLSRPSADI